MDKKTELERQVNRLIKRIQRITYRQQENAGKANYSARAMRGERQTYTINGEKYDAERLFAI